MTTTSQAQILLADEDEVTRRFLEDNLTADGFSVDAVADHTAALARLRTTNPDLVLVDVNGTTLKLIDSLRDSDTSLLTVASDLPAIVLTSQGDDVHLVRLLDRGSDDVVVKPFSYPELRARIGAVLRRTAPRRPRPMLAAGPLVIDLRRHEVTVAGEPVELSALEYTLACKLASDPTRVLTKVNFEPRPNEGKGSEGFRGSGRDYDSTAIPSVYGRFGHFWTADWTGMSDRVYKCGPILTAFRGP